MIILREKSFARRDYEGLSKEGEAKLREYRNDLARKTRATRNEHNAFLSRRIESGKGKRGFRGREAKYDRLLEGNKQVADSYRMRIMMDEAKQRKQSSAPISEPKPQIETPKPEPNLKPNTQTPRPNPQPKPQTKEVTEGFLKRNWNKLGTGGKIAAISVPVAAAAVGTGLAIKKHNDKKKSQEKSFSKIKRTIEHGEDKGGKYTITKYRDPETGELREEKNYISKKPKRIC